MSKAPQDANYCEEEGLDAYTLRKVAQADTTLAVIKNADMSERMQQHAVDCCKHAFEQKRILDDIAEIIKTEFDMMYQPTWHCVVGRGLGSYVTHEEKNFIFFTWGEVGVLLWRTLSIEQEKIENGEQDDEGREDY